MLLKSTRYELEIESLFNKKGETPLFEWIRTHCIDQLKDPHVSNGCVMVSASELMKLAKSQVVIQIHPDRNPSDLIKARAQVIYKYLCNLHRKKRPGNEFYEELQKKLDQIEKAEGFPMHNNKGTEIGGNKDKYQPLSRALAGESTGSLATVKLAFAVFGFTAEDYIGEAVELPDVAELAEAKSEPTSEEQPVEVPGESSVELPAKPSFDNRKRILIGIGLLLGLLIISSVILYTIRDREAERVRPRISTEQLFGRVFSIKSQPESLDDSLEVTLVSTHYDDFMAANDTIGLNQIWVRLAVRNYSSQHFFPDGIYIKPLGKSSLIGQAVKSGTTNNSKPNLNLSVKEEQDWPYEWLITNNEDQPLLPARSEVRALVKVDANEKLIPAIHEFEVMMRFHDSEGNDKIIRTHKPFKIAFD